MALTTTQIQSVYVAFFNRPADPVGLNYWATNNSDLQTLMSSFAASAEYTAQYAGKTAVQTVNTIYNNLFGRDAEATGLLYWAGHLTAGNLTIANIAYSISQGAQGTDATAFANKTSAAVAFTAALDLTPEIIGYSGEPALVLARAFIASVTDNASLATAIAPAALAASVAAVTTTGTGVVGQTFTLTTGVDTMPGLLGSLGTTGTNGNDTINGTDTTAVLDVVNGGNGNDTYNYSDVTGGKNINTLGLSLTSVETINVRSTAAALATTTGFTGVNDLNVLQGASTTVVASATTKVGVSGVSGAVIVDGGSTQTVTTAGTTVTLGATTGAAGAINVTHTAQGANAIAIDGGTTVNVTSSGRVAAGTITVGADGTPILPTGAVTVTASEGLASGGTAALIRVDGGSSVAITENITGSAAAITTASTSGAPGSVTGAAIAVNAGTTTTSVSVTQTKSAAAVAAVVGKTAVAETSTVTFGAMAAAGDSVTVNGLTFTAAKALTAAEVAAAFGSLTAADTQVAGGPVANGTFSGTSGTAAWVSGAASGTTVGYTAVTAGSGPAALTISKTGTASLPTATAPTTGVAAATAKTGVLGVINGAVTINDNATAAITTVTVDGYANSTIGAGTTLSKLATLSLANSGGATAGATDATMGVNAAGVTSLALNLNAVKGNVTLDAGGASIKTLNVTTATADSSFALTAAAVETLTVAGTNKATFSADLAALKTVTVSGSAGLTLAAAAADTITSINTSATTGTVTASIDATKATYTGGAGVDSVTTTAIAPTKAIALGAGNDTMTLLSGTNAMGVGGTIDGGADTDTLSMVTADAVTASASTVFAAAVTGFERLTLTGATGAQTVDVAKLGSYNYVTSAGRTGVADILTINNLVSTGTLAITTAPTGADTTGSITVNVTDASVSGHITDVLNIALSNAGALAAGTVKAAGVETVSITANDTAFDTTKGEAIDAQSLTLIDTAAKTITIGGNANFTLTTAGNTAVTVIDGSNATGKLTVTAAGTVATTITGGSAADTLTASSTAGATVAQVSTITFTDTTAMTATDTLAITGGTGVISVPFNTSFAQTLADLTAAAHADASFTATLSGTTITLTAQVPGTAFTAAGVFTDALASTVTATPAEGAVNAVKDVDTLTFTQVGVMGAGDAIGATVDGTTVSANWNTDFATTVANLATAIANISLGSKFTATSVGGVITITAKAGVAAFVESGTFTDDGTGALGDVTVAPAEGAVNHVADVDTLAFAQTVGSMATGDTITATVGGLSTAAIAFNTSFNQTITDVATAIAGLGGGAKFTATNTAGTITITAKDSAGGDAFTSSAVYADNNATVSLVTVGATATPIANSSSASATGDVLNGGNGNDILVAGNLAQLTGGAGKDTFDMRILTTDVNSYATIKDGLSGDVILTGATVFKAAGVVLDPSTATFQDYANAAVKNTDATDVTWFQFGGNTYVVDNNSNSTVGFNSASDFIIKITGAVDLSTASFSASAGTIEFA